MGRRKTILGTILVLVVSACALGSGNASAITLHACEETVAWATTQEYTSGTCETKGTGEFRTVPVAEGTLTSPTPVTSQFIAATIAGLAVEIECKGMSGTGKGENFIFPPPASPVSYIKALKIKYFECTVLKPKGGGCVIKGEPPIETSGLRLATSLEEGTIRPELFAEGAGVIAVIKLEGCKAAGLNGERQLKGNVQGFTGADPSVIEFTEGGGGALTWGGSPATYTGNIRLFMEGTTKRLAFELP